MDVATTRRPAFRAGTAVMLHPDTNPEVDSNARSDRGRVVSCRPMDDMRHLDIVMVVWDSTMLALTPEQEELPLSHWATPHASTRLHAARGL